MAGPTWQGGQSCARGAIHKRRGGSDAPYRETAYTAVNCRLLKELLFQ